MEETEKVIVQFLQQNIENCEAIVLFGSYARGTQNKESAIDIAFKTTTPISKRDIFYLSQELEELLKIEVDLINLAEIGDGFRYEILMTGKVLYCQDPFNFENYKLRMYREYLELNESRQMIIDRIKKEEKQVENEAVLMNQYDSMDRCIKRINEEYEDDPNHLQDYHRLDGIVLNLQRACEIAIDMAMYVVSTRKLGIPQTKKEAFELLEKNHLISVQMLKEMKGMTGFRRYAVHDYKEIDEEILQDVIENHLTSLIDFAREMINLPKT